MDVLMRVLVQEVFQSKLMAVTHWCWGTLWLSDAVPVGWSVLRVETSSYFLSV